MITNQQECDKFNEWMAYIHKERLKHLKPKQEITEPKNLTEWLEYIHQQRNSPYPQRTQN